MGVLQLDWVHVLLVLLSFACGIKVALMLLVRRKTCGYYYHRHRVMKMTMSRKDVEASEGKQLATCLGCSFTQSSRVGRSA